MECIAFNEKESQIKAIFFLNYKLKRTTHIIFIKIRRRIKLTTTTITTVACAAVGVGILVYLIRDFAFV